MPCEKCDYRDKKEVKKFGKVLCTICNSFAPFEKEKFEQFITEKIDWKVLETFRDNDVDAVIHLAALKSAGDSMENPGKYSETNISGTINILNACVDNDISNIIFSSSACVYGSPEYVPVDESHNTSPENYYGFTKLEIEKILPLNQYTTNPILSSNKMQINVINQIAKELTRFLLERSMDGICFSPEEVSAVSERGFTS